MFGSDSSRNADRGSHALEFEFPVPDVSDPCRGWNSIEGYCLNTQRFIRYVHGNGGMQLVCGNGHAQLDEGKAFIPSYEFAEGGRYAGVLPPEIMPAEATVRESRWKLPHRATERLAEFNACARCGVTEFNSYNSNDTGKLLGWLTEFAPELAAQVHAEVRKVPGARMESWFSYLPVSQRTRIVERLKKSVLTVDHGIPRKIGNRVWASLSRDEQRFLQETLLFRMCKGCNYAKGAKLIPLDELTKMYSDVIYGSLIAAELDTIRWSIFESIIHKIYEESDLSA